MTLAIEMKDVMKSFNEKTALRNVNIEVKQGEILDSSDRVDLEKQQQ